MFSWFVLCLLFVPCEFLLLFLVFWSFAVLLFVSSIWGFQGFAFLSVTCLPASHAFESTFPVSPWRQIRKHLVCCVLFPHCVFPFCCCAVPFPVATLLLIWVPICPCKKKTQGQITQQQIENQRFVSRVISFGNCISNLLLCPFFYQCALRFAVLFSLWLIGFLIWLRVSLFAVVAWTSGPPYISFNRTQTSGKYDSPPLPTLVSDQTPAN